ncbi:MAG TPA: cupin domain-containing protein [Firmicutes bacterium]|nr:cupin domain-containing protein [Bacillota bacterium]
MTEYSIHADIKYGPLELIEAGKIADECAEKWWNQSLCGVNDCVVRLGVFEGEFHWHKHDKEDEFFYVIEGKLMLDFQDGTVELEPKQGMMVPRGVMHRTRASVRTVVLMVEGLGIEPRGD